MKINKYFYTKTLIFLIALIWMLSPFSFPRPNALAISVEDEKKRGQEAALYGQYTDAVMDSGFVKQYFNELGQYLIAPVDFSFVRHWQ